MRCKQCPHNAILMQVLLDTAKSEGELASSSAVPNGDLPAGRSQPQPGQHRVEDPSHHQEAKPWTSADVAAALSGAVKEQRSQDGLKASREASTLSVVWDCQYHAHYPVLRLKHAPTQKRTA